MALRMVRRLSPPPRRRLLRSCMTFPVLMGALILVWFVYLFNVLSMAVRVHKLDPVDVRNETIHSAGRDLANLRQVAAAAASSRNAGVAVSAPKQEEPKEKATNSSFSLPNNLGGLPLDYQEIILEQQRAAADAAVGIKPKPRRPGWQPNPFGHMVEPEDFLGVSQKRPANVSLSRPPPPPHQILKAYLEPIDKSTWNLQPLPVRQVTANDLTLVEYPKLNSCQRLPEQWPVDDYPDEDPFLPWIHDVFPTHDGKFLQFVAQNKRRCHTGTTPDEEAILEQMAPQVALFQHVPIQKLANLSTPESPRYRLTSHEQADPESVSTRFICRFKPSGEITFSEFNNDYEWVGFRKKLRRMFSPDGRDNKQIHSSQLLFKCPIPESLVDTVRRGDSVVNDWATLFVDLIPIRTPPRYGPPEEFLSPYYVDEALKASHRSIGTFNPIEAWGHEHILPALEDSGRWENIPICQPSLMTYEPEVLDFGEESVAADGEVPKHHHLVSCLWTSTGYTTRGNRYAINDGQRRLVEWITFNKILGFDHFYIYDNSGALSDALSLQPVADLFPGDVTVINWPSRVCNNNPNNVDSVGERSSQYAAESSCRLRFGPHVNWIGQFDIDEYLVPMGEYTSVLPLLEKLDQENTKIISFASWRAWPRMTHINPIVPIRDKDLCGRSEPCFELSIRPNNTYLEGYNCDRQKPGEKTKVMPAEKQIYRAEYVTQHFIHYSTVTQTTNLKADEYDRKFGHKRLFPDPLSRFTDEVNEALMLHSKAVARQDTAGWEKNCHSMYSGLGFDQCRLGIPWPEGDEGKEYNGKEYNAEGWLYNCYVNRRIDNFWGPQLRAKLKEKGLQGN